MDQGKLPLKVKITEYPEGMFPPEVPPEEIPGQLFLKLFEQQQETVNILKQIVKQLATIAPRINIEPSPTFLTALIKALRHEKPGVFRLLVEQHSFKAPAGKVAILPFHVAPGWVCAEAGPIRLTSTYYSEMIRIVGRIGELYITRPEPVGESFREPVELPYSEVVPVYDDEIIYLAIINHTTTDAIITAYAKQTWLERSYYRSYIIPWLLYPLELLERLVREGKV